MNARQVRWLEFLSEYDFNINHIKGKENKVVDALNRRAHEMLSTTVSMYRSNLKDEILKVPNSDQHYLQVKELLQQGNLQPIYKYYELKDDGFLMYRGKVYMLKSQELKILVLREMHNEHYDRHLGYQKTISIVMGQYFWPRMKKEVVDYIAICLECQKVKDEHRHPTGLL